MVASEDHPMSNFDIFDFVLSDEEMELVCALHRCGGRASLISGTKSCAWTRTKNESRVLRRAE
jgi:hypothetical protein